MVEVVDLYKRGRLHGINLRLEAGSLALLGPNGAGKSTLLGLLAGRLRADGGLVRLMGYPGNSLEAARHRAYIPQQIAFPPTLRVDEVLETARRLKGVAVRQKVEALERMGLASQLRRPVAQLSGGWRQRLALAAGLMGQPRLWLLDEPASALDTEGLQCLQTWLEAHLNSGGLVLLSAHRQEEVLRLAQRYIRLEEGRVVHQGILENFYDSQPS